MKGNQVLMVSGSDAHGTPITVAADEQGISARELFEKYHQSFLTTQQEIGISYDLFTHTDTENHYRVAQDIFLSLHEKGYLYREVQKQLYSESENRYLPDRYVEVPARTAGMPMPAAINVITVARCWMLWSSSTRAAKPMEVPRWCVRPNIFSSTCPRSQNSCWITSPTRTATGGEMSLPSARNYIEGGLRGAR